MLPNKPPKGSRTAKITAIVGDDYYDLKLDFGLLEEFEDKHGVGAFYVLRKFSDQDMMGGITGDFRVKWVYDVIRLGLVGGGMPPREAVKFADRHLREGFLLDYLPVATNALYAALHGPEEDPVKFDEPTTPEDGEPGEPTPEELTPTPSAESHGENITNSAEQPD